MTRKPRGVDPENYSYRVTLSCGHVWYKARPLPAVGDKVDCTACWTTDAPIVIATVDERELEVFCPDCNRTVVGPFHLLATLSAATAASVHNAREKKGHHAIVRETGNYITNG